MGKKNKSKPTSPIKDLGQRRKIPSAKAKESSINVIPERQSQVSASVKDVRRVSYIRGVEEGQERRSVKPKVVPNAREKKAVLNTRDTAIWKSRMTEALQEVSVLDLKAFLTDDQSKDLFSDLLPPETNRSMEVEVDPKGEDVKMWRKSCALKRGFVLKETAPDGNCGFSAISFNHYGHPNGHSIIRLWTTLFMIYHPQYYHYQMAFEQSPDLTGFFNFPEYISKLFKLGCWVNPVVTKAAGDLSMMETVLFEDHSELGIIYKEGSETNPIIRARGFLVLLFVDNSHYNAMLYAKKYVSSMVGVATVGVMEMMKFFLLKDLPMDALEKMFSWSHWDIPELATRESMLNCFPVAVEMVAEAEALLSHPSIQPFFKECQQYFTETILLKTALIQSPRITLPVPIVPVFPLLAPAQDVGRKSPSNKILAKKSSTIPSNINSGSVISHSHHQDPIQSSPVPLLLQHNESQPSMFLPLSQTQEIVIFNESTFDSRILDRLEEEPFMLDVLKDLMNNPNSNFSTSPSAGADWVWNKMLKLLSFNATLPSTLGGVSADPYNKINWVSYSERLRDWIFSTLMISKSDKAVSLQMVGRGDSGSNQSVSKQSADEPGLSSNSDSGDEDDEDLNQGLIWSNQVSQISKEIELFSNQNTSKDKHVIPLPRTSNTILRNNVSNFGNHFKSDNMGRSNLYSPKISSKRSLEASASSSSQKSVVSSLAWWGPLSSPVPSLPLPVSNLSCDVQQTPFHQRSNVTNIPAYHTQHVLDHDNLIPNSLLSHRLPIPAIQHIPNDGNFLRASAGSENNFDPRADVLPGTFTTGEQSVAVLSTISSAINSLVSSNLSKDDQGKIESVKHMLMRFYATGCVSVDQYDPEPPPQPFEHRLKGIPFFVENPGAKVLMQLKRAFHIPGAVYRGYGFLCHITDELLLAFLTSNFNHLTVHDFRTPKLALDQMGHYLLTIASDSTASSVAASSKKTKLDPQTYSVVDLFACVKNMALVFKAMYGPAVSDHLESLHTQLLRQQHEPKALRIDEIEFLIRFCLDEFTSEIRVGVESVYGFWKAASKSLPSDEAGKRNHFRECVLIPNPALSSIKNPGNVFDPLDLHSAVVNYLYTRTERMEGFKDRTALAAVPANQSIPFLVDQRSIKMPTLLKASGDTNSIDGSMDKKKQKKKKKKVTQVPPSSTPSPSPPTNSQLLLQPTNPQPPLPPTNPQRPVSPSNSNTANLAPKKIPQKPQTTPTTRSPTQSSVIPYVDPHRRVSAKTSKEQMQKNIANTAVMLGSPNAFLTLLSYANVPITRSDGKQVCIQAMSHTGCGYPGCARWHFSNETEARAAYAKLSTAGKLLIYCMNGFYFDEKLETGSQEQIDMVNLWLAKITPEMLTIKARDNPNFQSLITAGSSSAPRHWFEGAESHAQERELMKIIEASTGRKISDNMLPTDGAEALYEGDDCELAKFSKSALSWIKQKYPSLKRLSVNWLAHVTNLAADHLQKSGKVDEPRWLSECIASVSTSIMTNASVASNLLKQAAGINPLLASGSSSPKIDVSKFFHYKGTNIAKVEFCGKSFETIDRGETVFDPKRQLDRDNLCIIQALAFIFGWDPEALLKVGYEELEVWKEALGEPQSMMSPQEAIVRRMIHDLTRANSQDANIVKFCPFKGATKNARVVILSSEGGNLKVYVIQHKQFKEMDPSSKTGVILISNNHATPIIRFPHNLGGLLFDFDRGDFQNLNPYDANNFLLWMHREGIEIITTTTMTPEEMATLPRTIPSSQLMDCLCGCGERVLWNPTAAGHCGTRYDHLQTTNTSHVLPIISVGNHDVIPYFLDQTFQSGSDALKVEKSTIPPAILAVCASNQVHGGFSPTTLGYLSAQRSLEAQKWATMSSSDLILYNFGKPASDEARDLIEYLNKDLVHIDRKKMQDGDELEWQKTLNLLSHLILKSDQIAVLTGSIQASLAVYRQAWIKLNGSLRIDVNRIKQLKGLLPDAVIDNLTGVAEMGVPMLVLKDRIVPEMQPGPYKSAKAAEKEMAYSVLVDAAQARVLVFSEASRKIMVSSAVVQFSCGAADKKNADGTLSKKKRLTLDARPLNEETQQGLKAQRKVINLQPPPAITPKIMDTLRYIANLWKSYPGCRIVGFKRDFKDAFKLLHHSLADVGWLASQLPGSSKAVMVSSVMIFGWTYSPAWFCLFASALADAHNQTKCGEPSLNGDLNNHTDIFVDDALCFFIDIGNARVIRPWLYHKLTELMFDSNAISQEKLVEEGEVSDYIKAWGVIWDLRNIKEDGLWGAKIAIPPEKCEKMLSLLKKININALVERKFPKKLHEQIQGLAVYMSICCKPLHAILFRLFAMAASADEMWLVPMENVNFKWDEYAQALVLLKMLCQNPTFFSTCCTSSVAKALSPSDQLNLGVRRAFVGSDATGTRGDGRSGIMAAIDYQNNEWAAAEVSLYMNLLKLRRDARENEDSLIAAAEFLAILALASQNGHKWTNLLIIHACDNHTVVDVVRAKKSSSPILQYCLDILMMLEIKYKFEFISIYIHTKRNILADDISRKYYDVTPEELQHHIDSIHPGLHRITMDSLLSFLGLHISDDLKARILPDDVHSKEASQMMDCYWQGKQQFNFLNNQERDHHKWKVIELNAGTAPFIRTNIMEALGLVEEDDRLLKPCESFVSSVPIRSASINKFISSFNIYKNNNLSCEGDVVCINAVYGEEKKRFQHPSNVIPLLQQVNAKIVIWVLHKSFLNLHESQLMHWDAKMLEAGFTRTIPLDLFNQSNPVESINVECLKAGQNLDRIILQYELSEIHSILGPSSSLLPSSSRQLALEDALEDLGMLEDELWINGEFRISARESDESGIIQAGMITVGSKLSVLQKGHLVKVKNDPIWWTVVELEGSLAKVSQHHCDYSDTPCKLVKIIDIVERKQRKLQVLSIKGTSNAILAWSHSIEGFGNVLIHDTRSNLTPAVRRLSYREVAKLCGFDSAEVQCLVSLKNLISRKMLEFVIGSTTPHQLACALLIRASIRLNMWRKRLQLAESTTEETSDVESIDTREYSIRASGGSRRPRIIPQLPLSKVNSLPNLTNFLIRSGIQDSTRNTYESQMSLWRLWRHVRGLAETLSQRAEDQGIEDKDLSEYVTWRGLHGNMAHSTLHVNLFAIRRFHLELGLKDPLEDKRMLSMTMKGLLKRQGGPLRKIPISMTMIRDIASTLDLERWNHLVVVTAIVTMFLFLLRRGEVLSTRQAPDSKKCLKVSMLVFRRNGEELHWNYIQAANEVVLLMGRSKADPLGQGSVANIFEESGDHLCLLSLFKRMHRLNPTHFNPKREGFLFTTSDSKVVQAELVSNLLKSASVRAGYPRDALSVISLRSGGASAMWDAGFSAEEIKLRGRWASDCWRRYVWGGQSSSTSVAKKLLGSTFKPLAAIRRYARGTDT